MKISRVKNTEHGAEVMDGFGGLVLKPDTVAEVVQLKELAAWIEYEGGSCVEWFDGERGDYGLTVNLK